jgi:hypothetical protein
MGCPLKNRGHDGPKRPARGNARLQGGFSALKRRFRPLAAFVNSPCPVFGLQWAPVFGLQWTSRLTQSRAWLKMGMPQNLME